MAIEENILNIYDFDSLREQIFNCIQNNELIQENKAIFQKEYKIIRKAAIDFIDEVNQKINDETAKFICFLLIFSTTLIYFHCRYAAYDKAYLYPINFPQYSTQ